jgi:hypothetical protein
MKMMYDQPKLGRERFRLFKSQTLKSITYLWCDLVAFDLKDTDPGNHKHEMCERIFFSDYPQT